MQVKPKFRLRTILLIVNLVVLLLPLAGIYFFRIYENGLIRQTELELISQGAFISSIYKNEVSGLVEDDKDYGIEVEYTPYTQNEAYYHPINPQLSLSNDILSRRPDGVQKENAPADTRALDAGKRLRSVLIDAQKTTLSGMKILDYNGIVVSGRFEEGQSFAHLEEIKYALQGKYTSVLRERIMDEPPPALASISRGTGVRVFVALPIIHNDRLIGIVYLSRTPQNILKHLYAEKNKVILVGILLLAATLVLALFTSYTIAKPIHALIHQTRQASSDDKSAIQPLKSPVTKEVALLSESFAEMAKTLEERSEYIKQFAMHVSHEFKTPLTAIQGAIELMQEHFDEMSDEERQKFLKNISNDTDRLKRLVTRLLELARADVASSSNETTSIKEIVDQLTERYKDYNLNIAATFDNDNLEAAISREAFETVLTNLLDNSSQHGAKNVTIDVTDANNTIQLTVADDGIGISQANRDKIFTPFFTTNRDNGGTGLGLEIVKSILKAHNSNISLEESEKGTKFAITLKNTKVTI